MKKVWTCRIYDTHMHTHAHAHAHTHTHTPIHTQKEPYLVKDQANLKIFKELGLIIVYLIF